MLEARGRHPRPAGPPRKKADRRASPHLAAVLVLLLQQLGNRGHDDAGLEQGPPGCARKEEAGLPPPPPRPRLRRPPGPDGSGGRPCGLRHHPSSPGSRCQARHVLPPARPPPSPRPSILKPGKEQAMRGPTLAPHYAGRRPTAGPRGAGAAAPTRSERGEPREKDRARSGRPNL